MRACVLLAGAFVLAACTAEPSGRPADGVAPAATPPEAAPAADGTPTIGGDGSPITLLALTSAHLDDADLPGELACAFATDADGTLLLARADVQPDGEVRAAINHNTFLERLANARAGGFDDLADGITLAGRGLTLTLERGAARPTGDESTAHAAMLRVQRADGAERAYDGTWTCGP